MRVSDDPTALAAIGAYRYMEGDAIPNFADDPYWAQRISRAVSRGSVVLAIDRALIDDVRLPEAQLTRLREAWCDGSAEFHRSSIEQGLRVFIVSPDVQVEAAALALLSAASDVVSVALVDRHLQGPERWGWPLRIGAAGGEIAQALNAYPHPQLISVDTTFARGARFDLLIMASAADLDRAAAQDAATGFLLLFVAPGDRLQAGQLRACNVSIRFRAGALTQRPDDLAACIHKFLDMLAHNAPPDRAIYAAVGGARDLVVIGDPEFLDRARVSAVTAALEAVLEHHYARGDFPLPSFRNAMRAMPKITAPAWISEGGAASDSASVLTTIRSGLPATTRGSAALERAGRHLQAQVFEQSGAGYVPRTRSFEAGARHEIRVRVGPTGLDWISVPTPFPDKEVAASESRLTVRLVLPAPLSEPEQQEILLGVTGASTVARFEIYVPADPPRFQAMIIVFHQGKHVQTGELFGVVTHGQPAEGAGIAFTRGAASTAEPRRQRMFDLAVWKDGDQLLLEEYRPDAAWGEVSHTRREPSLQGIDKRLDAIREYLFDAARKADQLSAGLESAGLPMLQALAEHGEFLRRKLFGSAALSHVRRIQVVSPSSSDFFPAEFLYDFVLPNEDAELCPQFKQHDGPGCSDQCLARGGDPGYVCPSGFWALNRVIERQVRPRDQADCHQPESSASQPDLMRLSGIVFAASDAVNEGNPNRVAQTVNDISRFAPVYRAASWPSWQKQVADHYPALLVALPHHVVTRGFPALQIEADQILSVNRITTNHVLPQNEPVGSMILLLGCNTANTAVQYEDFVNELRCHGASLVIGTLTYVLGTHAAQMAREFVAQMWSVPDPAPIGEIMRDVRRRMLVHDNPLALAITAFGDADWRFRVEG